MTNPSLRPFHENGITVSRASTSVDVCDKCGVLTGSGANHICVSFQPTSKTKSKKKKATAAKPACSDILSKISEPAIAAKPRGKLLLALLVTVLVCLWHNNTKTQPVLGKSLLSTAAPSQTVSSQEPSFKMMPSLQGQWLFLVYTGASSYPGSVQLKQSGATLYGGGRDSAGEFTMAGQVTPPDRILLTKKYSVDACRRGAHPLEINFSGTIKNLSSGRYACDGHYQTQIKSGYTHSYFRKSRWTTVTEEWSARRVSSSIDEATFVAPQNPAALFNPLRALDAQPIQSTSGTSHHDEALGGITKLFLSIIGGIMLLVAAFIAFINLKIFGPDGITSKNEVARYIPSQLRSEHNKMLAVFGQPLVTGGVAMGTRADWRWWSFWKPRQINIPASVRKENPHMLVIGCSGKGKTRLISSMVSRDIECSDRAVVVIDTCGELTRLISSWMKTNGTEHRNRMVVIDPSKSRAPAYNPLEVSENGDLQAAASAVVRGFKSIYVEKAGNQSKWNHQTANILRNAAILLMINGRTLADLPMLLQDNDYRDLMLEKLDSMKGKRSEYITLHETWSQYKRLARSEQWIDWVEPILNQASPLLSDERLRSIVDKEKSELDLKEIILKKKVLIIRIPKGEMGQNANLIGSLLITGLQQAALNLLKDPSAPKERPVALYLDEMDLLADKETITSLCSETVRYQIGFVAALKTLQYIPEDFRHRLLISVGTIAAFSMVRKDGELIGPQMFRVDGRKFRHQHLQMFTQRMNIPNPDRAFHLITDEEKLNIDRVVAQETQHYFCYRVGTVAGVFRMRANNG